MPQRSGGTGCRSRKLEKSAVGYGPAEERARRCATCRHFLNGVSCRKVRGHIEARMSCRLHP